MQQSQAAELADRVLHQADERRTYDSHGELMIADPNEDWDEEISIDECDLDLLEPGQVGPSSPLPIKATGSPLF